MRVTERLLKKRKVNVKSSDFPTTLREFCEKYGLWPEHYLDKVNLGGHFGHSKSLAINVYVDGVLVKNDNIIITEKSEIIFEECIAQRKERSIIGPENRASVIGIGGKKVHLNGYFEPSELYDLLEMFYKDANKNIPDTVVITNKMEGT